MGHKAPNYQQLMNINLFVKDESYGFVVTLICVSGFIQDYAAFSYKGVGESSQFKIGCFHSGVCMSDIGWKKVEGSGKYLK